MDGYNTYKKKAYRFIKVQALIETIETKKLRFTRVDYLNDPLDCGKYLLPFPYELFDKVKGYINYALECANEKVLSSLYVCSFCKNYCSPYSYLLWSHYANNHNDVCFEIDFSKIDFLGCPDEITYQPLDEIVNLRNKLASNQVGSFIVLTKSDLWKYEEEIRLIVDTKPDRSITKEFKIDSDLKHLYVPFNLNIISKVIFGVNAQVENIKTIIKLFESNGYIPQFEKMRINPKTLRLEQTEIIE